MGRGVRKRVMGGTHVTYSPSFVSPVSSSKDRDFLQNLSGKTFTLT